MNCTCSCVVAPLAQLLPPAPPLVHALVHALETAGFQALLAFFHWHKNGMTHVGLVGSGPEAAQGSHTIRQVQSSSIVKQALQMGESVT